MEEFNLVVSDWKEEDHRILSYGPKKYVKDAHKWTHLLYDLLEKEEIDGMSPYYYWSLDQDDELSGYFVKASTLAGAIVKLDNLLREKDRETLIGTIHSPIMRQYMMIEALHRVRDLASRVQEGDFSIYLTEKAMNPKWLKDRKENARSIVRGILARVREEVIQRSHITVLDF